MPIRPSVFDNYMYARAEQLFFRMYSWVAHLKLHFLQTSVGSDQLCTKLNEKVQLLDQVRCF